MFKFDRQFTAWELNLFSAPILLALDTHGLLATDELVASCLG